MFKPSAFATVAIKNDPNRTVGIQFYDEIYNAVGVTMSRKLEWENEYGMDSLGIGTKGVILVPGFPVFSKVAWMYIDPIDLSEAETRDLIDECARALKNATNPHAVEELRQIHQLALDATARSEVIRFGHP